VGEQKKVDLEEHKDEEMEFQDAKGALKAVYGHSNSKSSTNERRKTLHVMFGGSWEITSRRIIKTLCRVVVAATPTPRAVPHHKWMETSTVFGSSDCPKNMGDVGQLPLLISPTVSNIKLYHVLVDSGVALNLITLIAFKEMQILMSKLALLRPFLGVGPISIMPRGSISILVTFGTPENYCTESILFNIAEVNLPFNAILGRLALYQFMAVAHFGYLVLKMPEPNGIIKIRGDHTCHTRF
jgi:hypothetical protein